MLFIRFTAKHGFCCVEKACVAVKCHFGQNRSTVLTKRQICFVLTRSDKTIDARNINRENEVDVVLSKRKV